MRESDKKVIPHAIPTLTSRCKCTEVKHVTTSHRYLRTKLRAFIWQFLFSCTTVLSKRNTRREVLTIILIFRYLYLFLVIVRDLVITVFSSILVYIVSVIVLFGDSWIFIWILFFISKIPLLLF